MCISEFLDSLLFAEVGDAQNCVFALRDEMESESIFVTFWLHDGEFVSGLADDLETAKRASAAFLRPPEGAPPSRESLAAALSLLTPLGEGTP